MKGCGGCLANVILLGLMVIFGIGMVIAAILDEEQTREFTRKFLRKMREGADEAGL